MNKEEKLISILEKLLTRINGVTAYHRHGNAIPKKSLDSLSDLQIDIEYELKEIKNDKIL
jgi:hypothetical protein